VSGLGHYLEDEGIPTVAIALVREHAERMRPPRALWVPFPLGRPFGAPGDPAFQRRVVLAALSLLEAPEGPVLEDFPEDAPAGAPDDMNGWVCPVSFASPSAAKGDALDRAIADEIRQLRPWYDLAVEKRGRTTVGLSGLDPADAARFLEAFAAGGDPDIPVQGAGRVDALRWCSDDVKAYYLEAVTAQPGNPSPGDLERWFWTETTMAKVLQAVARRCRSSDDDALREVGEFMIVPGHYQA